MRRILVIRGGALGDVILTLPAIGALRQAFPKAHIEVLGAANRLSLALHPAYADTIMDAERLKIYRLFGREVREPSKFALYLRGFDLILSYVPAPDPIFIDNLRHYGPAQVLAWPTHPGSTVHATDHLLQPVLRFVETTPPAEPKVYPGAEHRHAANRFWQSAGLPQRGVLAIHPGSGGPHKLWPQKGWQQVLNWAAKRGVPGILIYGPAEQERGLSLQLENPGCVWKQLVHTPLLQLAAILEKCAAFAGHDSGISHLAGAVGTPTLALFGPTDPRVWGPRGQHVCVMWPASPGPLGLENLPAGEVIETLQAFMEGTFKFNPTDLGHTRLTVPA